MLHFTLKVKCHQVIEAGGQRHHCSKNMRPLRLLGILSPGDSPASHRTVITLSLMPLQR